MYCSHKDLSHPPNDVIDRYALRRNGVYIIDSRGSVRRKLERLPFSWFEEMKCRGINGVAVATPILKKRFQNQDS